MRDALRKVQTGKHKDTTIDAEYDRLVNGSYKYKRNHTYKGQVINVNNKNYTINMPLDKDLKDSIKQVAYDNGYTLTHYLSRMIMNEVSSYKK